MKCLTILNPWPAYILLPEKDADHKRVENRSRPFSYRGPLLIHAGTSKRMMDPNQKYPGLTFQWGKIVGVCDLVDCVELGHLRMAYSHVEWEVNGRKSVDTGFDVSQKIVPADASARFPWLAKHRHTHGPFCLVLQNVRRFREPVVCRGQQGLFNVKGVPLLRVQEQLKEAIAV